MLPAPDAEEARRLLQDELAKSAYVEAQPNIVERILGARKCAVAVLGPKAALAAAERFETALAAA